MFFCYSNHPIFSLLPQDLCMCCSFYLQSSPHPTLVNCYSWVLFQLELYSLREAALALQFRLWMVLYFLMVPSLFLSLYINLSWLWCIHGWDCLFNDYFNPDCSFMKVETTCNFAHLLFATEFSGVLMIICGINE